LPLYCAELLDKTESKNSAFGKLKDIDTLIQKNFFEQIKFQPFRLRGVIEMYFAKFLVEAKYLSVSTMLDRYEKLLDLTTRYVLTATAQMKAEMYPVLFF
jgi:hypothetical protein